MSSIPTKERGKLRGFFLQSDLFTFLKRTLQRYIYLARKGTALLPAEEYEEDRELEDCEAVVLRCRHSEGRGGRPGEERLISYYGKIDQYRISEMR